MGISKIFSKRNKPPADTFSYEFTERVRSRIINTLGQMNAVSHTRFGHTRGNMIELMADVAERCLCEYGSLYEEKKSGFRVVSGNANVRLARAGEEHFSLAPVEHAIDFVEMLFHSSHYRLAQDGVEAVNLILKEEGVGFEFSPYQTRQVRTPIGRVYLEVTYPEAIKKTNEMTHVNVIMPTLTLLSGPTWKVANEEMHDAHKANREGRLEDAITACGRAFESVLKTICAEKKWPFDPDKDTASALIEICRVNKLFEPFYASILVTNATIRNKFGGHGKGPQPLYKNEDAYVQHMLQQTSSHILLLAKLAGMS
jgi:hypothetical protein